jgi:hypothetical protein
MELEKASIVYLNIPNIPTEIDIEICKFAEQKKLDDSSRIIPENVRSALGWYGRKNEGIFMPNWAQENLINLYKNYFNQEIDIIVGKFVNPYTDGMPVENPPHCDRYRFTAINYVLESGGPNVTNCFYKNKRKIFDPDLSEQALEENLDLDFEICLPKHRWLAFDVQTYHSVKNIIGTRLVLSILLLKNNPDFETFKQQYSHILTTE